MRRQRTSYKTNFAKFLDHSPEFHKIGQKQFAHELRISTQYMSDLFRGQRYATPILAVKAAILISKPVEQGLEIALQDYLEKHVTGYQVTVKSFHS